VKKEFSFLEIAKNAEISVGFKKESVAQYSDSFPCLNGYF
jgi:hypothetical protein